VCVCVCVCVYLYMYIYIYVYTHTNIYTYLYLYIYIYIYHICTIYTWYLKCITLTPPPLVSFRYTCYSSPMKSRMTAPPSSSPRSPPTARWRFLTYREMVESTLTATLETTAGSSWVSVPGGRRTYVKGALCA